MRTGRPPTPPEERFFAKVREDGECWIWTGTRNNGYGHFWHGTGRVYAHRWAFEHFRAEIPDGLDIDHLCKTPSCVNPWHAEPVSRLVNVQRSSAYRADDRCSEGHPLTQQGDRRVCRTCRNAACARYRARRKADA